MNIFFYTTLFWDVDWIFFLVFINKNNKGDRIHFFKFVNSLILARNYMPLKSFFYTKSFSSFVILLKWWSAGYTYLPRYHLKHSLSSVIYISIKTFFLDGLILLLVWYNCYPAKELYFKILILWSLTESVIPPEPSEPYHLNQ